MSYVFLPCWEISNCYCIFVGQVDLKNSGKTSLQVASHQGHLDICNLLLSSGADLEVQDEDGDTALHYSAFGWDT